MSDPVENAIAAEHSRQERALRDRRPAFTPGPWRIDEHLSMIVGPKGEPISGRANYALAAAAPDLYEVARAVVAAADKIGADGPGIGAARAALAKARGEQ
jgi:hypothetical protein